MKAREAAQAAGDNQEGTSQSIASPEVEKRLDDQAIIHRDDVKEPCVSNSHPPR